MERDASQPFCLVLASINSHAPWTGGDASIFDSKKLQLPPQFIDTEVTREYYARYLAEVGLLDQQVGDLTADSERKELARRTLCHFHIRAGYAICRSQMDQLECRCQVGDGGSAASLNPVRRLPLLW